MAEAFNKLIQAYRNKVLSQAQVVMWHNAFLDDRETVDKGSLFSRPVTSLVFMRQK